MSDDIMEIIKGSLGNPLRNFQTDPLTQQEIEAIIHTYSDELNNPDLEPEIREIYHSCIEILKKHLVLH